MQINLICLECKNYNVLEIMQICSAFPKGIPDEILYGDNNHTKPLEYQKNDIVFVPIEK